MASILGLLGGSFVAFHGLRVERDALKDERRVVEAKISDVAFSLRRQIRSWLGIDPPRDDGVSELVGLAEHFSNLSKDDLDSAESRLNEIEGLSAEVGGHIQEQVLKASLLFLAATNKLNTHLTTPRPAGGAVLGWIGLIQDAEKDLKECLVALETGPISESRLREEVELQERRKREDPLTQLADARRDEDEMSPAKIPDDTRR